jgi:hypothetical protein
MESLKFHVIVEKERRVAGDADAEAHIHHGFHKTGSNLRKEPIDAETRGEGQRNTAPFHVIDMAN